MPSLDEIRTLTIQAVQEGVDKATRDLNDLAKAQDGVAVVSEKTTKATRTVENALEGVRGKLDPVYRATLDFNRGQLALTMGLNGGRLSLDEFNKLSTLNKQRLEEATPSTNRFASAISDSTKELLAFGLRAVGVGTVVEALHTLMDVGGRMGEFSRQLRDSAETIGVNTDQLQALNTIASSVGVAADKNTLAFEQFTSKINQLRQGTGALFTELQKVSPELVRQLASTKDVTNAIDVMARAYAAASDQIQKNAIARAAFGRQGFAEGNVLTAIDKAGGIEAYRTGLNSTDALTQDQIKHWAMLSIEIEHATTLAKNNIASIFTTPVLEAEKRWADTFLEISREAKDFKSSHDLRDLINPNSMVGRALGMKPRSAETPGASFSQRFGDFGGGPAQTKAAFDASVMKEWVSALGGAVTLQEQLKLKTLELAAAYDRNALGIKGSAEAEDRLGRAKAALNLESEIQIESRRLSLLGQAASVQEIVAQKIREITKARMEGVNLSRTERDLITETAQVQAVGAKLQRDNQFGVAASTDLYVQKLMEFNLAAKERNYTDAQWATGLGIIKREQEQVNQALEVRRSMLPALKQLELESGNIRTLFDQTASSSLNSVASGLTDITMGTKTAAVGFRDLGNTVLRALEEMLIKMTIVRALAMSLQSAFGLAGSGLFGAMEGKSSLIGWANGGVFAGGVVQPFAGGGIVDRPTLFPMANGAGLMGEAGPEAIMPLRRGADGRLGVASAGGSSGGVNVVINNNHSGADVSVRQNKDSSGRPGLEIIVAEVGRHMATGGFDGAMKARYGTQVQSRGR